MKLTAAFKVASKVVIAEEADEMNITATSRKQELKLREIGARAEKIVEKTEAKRHNSAWMSGAAVSLKLRLLLERSLTPWVLLLAVRLQRLPTLELKLLSL